jgi:bifunctional DNA-binding transcriptional regulator/antitoxin component of YhaV-PrlF toxin-antitoxin module
MEYGILESQNSGKEDSMVKLATAPLGAKGQITLPKKVRELLRVSAPGDLVGFMVDDKTCSIRLTRVELVPDEDPFTEEEYRKLDQLRKAPGGTTSDSAKAFLDDLNRDLKSTE